MEKYFEKVIGYEPLKMELRRILDVMKNKEKYDALGVRLPKNFLLHGKPGVGKTLISNSFIEASGWNSFICRKTNSDGDFVKEIKATFDEAKKNQPAIVFLDDVDKFANEDDEHKDAEEYVTVQSCIDEVKNDMIFVLATANYLPKLPDSLTRAGRFDKKFKVEYPTGEDAEKLLKYFLKDMQVSKEIEVKQIAQILGYCSCAELEAVINEAGIYAGFSDKKIIDMDDITKAFMKILFSAPESLDEYKKEHIKEIAYHEAGHTVLAEILNPKSVNIVSVCKHEGDIGGVTSQSLTDNYWYSKEEMENRVTMLLGGKAATEIVFGTVDTGSRIDIKRAFDIVDRFATDYCSYGFDKWRCFGEPSNHQKNKIENLIGEEIQRFYHKAKTILINNRKFLDKIATLLIEKKTILSADIDKIKKECDIVNKNESEKKYKYRVEQDIREFPYSD
jgi:cell division protease FtsH